MAAVVIALALVDAWIDGSLLSSMEVKPVQASIFWALVVCITIPAQLELAALTKNTGVNIFKSVAIPAGVLLASSWYVKQVVAGDQASFQFYYVMFVLALSLLALFIVQAFKYGTDGVIANCSVSLLSILYLGFLSGFFVGIRVDFGVWGFLMFMCVVKCSDIGAYTIGKIFGKHKFVPSISPAKTWEGLFGAVLFATIAAFAFGLLCDIMDVWMAVVFGVVFGFLGQLADLAESMIKRDAEQKDSSQTVPGFGGLLDVLDSPLATAPVAYMFFMLTN